MTVNLRLFSKHLFLLTFISLLLPSPTHSLVKCNRHLLNEFGLSGLKYSISDKMEICGHVLDKCCSIYDEIRIYKYWNEYTKPMMDTRTHDYMLYTYGITKQWFKMMRIDPQLIVLKYPVTRKIPYEQENCVKGMKEVGTPEEEEMANWDTEKAKITYQKLFYMTVVNKKKKFDPKKHTHDKTDERHWGVIPSRAHMAYHKQYGKHGTASIFHEKTDHTNLACKRVGENYTKDFIIVNELKTKYCLNLYKKFLNMDNGYLMRFMPLVKNFLTQNGDVKGGVYCSMCDAHQQVYFNVEKKRIMVKEYFCKSLLHKKKDLFNFMHIFFVEYMDSLLQYVSCFETDGKAFSFPFKNFMEKYRRRIMLVKNCLNATESPEFMDKCWFICKNYKFFGIDWFYNGDVQLVKRVYLAVFSFLHKFRDSEILYKKNGGTPGYLSQDNVDGMLVEPLNPGHSVSDKYYLDDRTRKDILGKLDLRYVPPKLTKKKKKKLEKKADKMMKSLNLPSVAKINKLKKDHKELKKKYNEVKGVHKKLAKYDKVKKFFKKWEKYKQKKLSKMANEKKKKKDPTTISGLVNQLLVIKQKHKVHVGHFPQRKLVLNNSFANDIHKALKDFGLPESIIKQQLVKSKIESRYLKVKDVDPEEAMEEKIKEEEEKEKEKLKPAKDPSRFKLNTVIIENANQIYEKNKEALGVKNFEILWGEQGINPFQSFELIDYKFNITSIIEKKIREEESIADSVIQSFLQTDSKAVNRFNFDFDSFVMDAGTVTDFHYIKYRRIALYAKLNGRMALLNVMQKKIKSLIRRHARNAHRKKIFKEAIKRRKQQKLAKMNAKLNTKVIANNHIDNEHFHDNFHGFKNYFLKVFGT